jgi:hypothetical protein
MRTPKLLAAIGTLLLMFAAPAHAHDYFGVRGGVYTDDSHAFLGAEGLFGLSHRVYLNPNIEYVFVPDTTYMTFNMDFHVDLPTHSDVYVWLGGGLAVLYVDPTGGVSDTSAGANFLAGVGLKGRVIPYLQAKLIAKSDAEFVIAFGLRF